MIDIPALRARAHRLNMEVHVINEELAPFYGRLKDIRREIVATHHHRIAQKSDDGRSDILVMTGYRRDGAGERVWLFEEQDRLSAENKPLVDRKRILQAEADAIGREIERHMDHEAFEKRQAAKRAGKRQGELL